MDKLDEDLDSYLTEKLRKLVMKMPKLMALDVKIRGEFLVQAILVEQFITDIIILQRRSRRIEPDSYLSLPLRPHLLATKTTAQPPRRSRGPQMDKVARGQYDLTALVAILPVGV